MTGKQVLAAPDFDRPFIVTTDASGYAIGAALAQVFEGGESVQFASRVARYSPSSATMPRPIAKH